MKYCQYCGTQLADDAAFCAKCGKSTGSVFSPEKKGNPVLFFVLSGISFLMTVIFTCISVDFWSKRFSGATLEFARKVKDYITLREHEKIMQQRDFYCVLAVVCGIAFAVLLIIGIIKAKKNKSQAK